MDRGQGVIGLSRLCTAVLLLHLLTSQVSAAVCWWDTADPLGLQGGSAIWSSSASNWNTDLGGGSARTAWGSNNDACFTASPGGTATVSGTVSVNSITFDTAAYTITGGTGVSLTGSGSVTVNTGQTATISSALSSSVTLTKSGAGTLKLTGSNAYTQPLLVDRGVLEIGSAGSIPNGVNLSFSNNPGALLLLDGPNYALTVPRLSGGGVSGGFLDLGSGGSLTFGSDNSNQTFSGVISGGTTLGTTLTKQGTGVQIFSYPNPYGYTGATLINAGTVACGSDNTNDNIFPLMSDVTVASTAKIDTNSTAGGSVSLVLGSLAGDGTVTNSRAGNDRNPTINLGYNGNSTTFSGIFTCTVGTNSLHLRKIGTGNLTLTSSSHTANGNLTLDGGALILGGANPSGAGQVKFASIYLNAGGNLTLDNTSALASAGAVDRLADVSTLYLQGGELELLANAGGSTELIKNLSFQPGLTTITIDASANTSGSTLLNFASDTAGGNSSFPNRVNGAAMLIRGTNLGNSSAAGVGAFATGTSSGVSIGNPIGGSGIDGTKYMSIRPDVLIDTTTTGAGSSFAVRSTTAPYYIRALTAAEYNTSSMVVASGVAAANNNNNYLVADNIQQMFSTPLQPAGTNVTNYTTTFNVTINSLTLQGNAGIVAPSIRFLLTGAPTISTLSITSGGLLAQSGSTTTLNVGILDPGGNQLLAHAIGDVNFTGYLNSNTPMLTKTGSGTLTINTQQFAPGGLSINGGRIVLASTVGTNSPYATPANYPFYLAVSNQRMTLYDWWVNSGTVDLHGNNQAIMNLRSDSAWPGSAGTITNTEGNALFSTHTNVSGGSVFAGTLTDTFNPDTGSGGRLAFYRGSDNTNWLWITSDNTYHGETTVAGGTTDLRDQGTFRNTSALNINYATLQLSNTGDQGSLYDRSDRVPSNVSVTLRGGTFNFYGSQGKASSQSLGLGGTQVALAEGFNVIQTFYGQSGTSVLTIGNLTRTAASGATVYFYGNLSGVPVDPFSGASNVNVSRTILNTINGSAPTLSAGKLLGGWALYGDHFASYNAIQGVTWPGSAGSQAYYVAGAGSLVAAQSSDNLNINSAIGVTGRTINSMRWTGDNNNIYLAAATDRLTVLTGIVSNANNLTMAGGQLTAGQTAAATDLFFYNAGTVNLNTKITDNAAFGSVRFIKSGTGALTLTTANTYSGGTVVNAGTINLNAPLPGLVTLPGGVGKSLTIDNATVTMNFFAGQIGSGTNVTLGGPSTLSLVGNNTVGSLTLNSVGGSSAWQILNAGGILTLGGDINVLSDNLAAQAVIQIGQLDLGGTTHNIQVNGLAPQGLRIESILRNGGINKTGSGTLSLNTGANYFMGGVNLQGGTLILGDNYCLGNGPFTIGAGTTLSGVGGGRTVYNPVTVNGSFTFGTSNNTDANVAMNGAITLAADSTMTTASPWNTDYLGQVRGTGALTKSGVGTLMLQGSAETKYTGATTVNAGVLQLNAAFATSPGSKMTIASGAILNLNGYSTFTGALDGAGTITNSSSTMPTLYFGGGSQNGNFSGQIVNYNVTAMSLFKVGTTTQTFSGTSLSSLTITTAGGTLAMQSGRDNTLVPTWPSLVITNLQSGGPATLDLNGTTQTENNRIVFGGPNSVSSSRGTLTLNSGTLVFPTTGDSDFVYYSAGGSPGAATFSGPGTVALTTVAGWRRINVEKSNSIAAGQSELTITANLVGAAATTSSGLLKYGAGAATISNNGGNTYLGQTTINGGTLRVSGGDAIPNTSQVWLNSSSPAFAAFDVVQSETIGSLTSNTLAAGSYGYNILQIEAGQTLSFGADNLAAGPTYNGRLAGPVDSSITKMGTGTQYFNGPMAYGMLGTINVDNGKLAMSGVNAMPYTATLSVNRGVTTGTFDVNNQATVIGAITGNGLVTNAATTPVSTVLSIGWANTASTFSGTFTGSGYLSVTKIGTATLTLNGTNMATGNLTVNDGAVTLSSAGGGAGSMTFASVIDTGGTLNLDNTAGTFANRLAGRPVTLSGGRFNVLAGTDAPTTENIGALTIGFGQGLIVVASSSQRGTLTAGSLARTTGGTAVFSGSYLGTGMSTGASIKFTTVPTFIGEDGGTNQKNAGILPYLLVDTTAGGPGAGGFATYDRFVGIRPLVGEEVDTDVTDFNNVRLGAAGTVTDDRLINSLQLAGIAPSVTISSGKTLTIESGGILANTNATIRGGILSAANELNLYAMSGATLNIASAVNCGVPLTKSGSGAVILQQLTSVGTITVNAGTLTLANGAMAALPSGNVLVVNGGTLDLGGNSQVISALTNNNPLTGKGGTVTSAVAATLTVLSPSNSTFSGVIAGSMSLQKTGNNVLTLTGPSSYSGATTVNAGTLKLLDGGKLTGTAGVNVNYGALLLDNSGLLNQSDRLNLAAPISLRGGTLTLQGAPGVLSTQAAGTVTPLEGANTVTAISVQGTAELTLGGLSRSFGQGTLNFGNVGVLTTDIYGYGTLAGGRVKLATAPALVNGILGGWATFNGTDFATYGNNSGIVWPGGNNSAPGYSALPLFLARPVDNINYQATSIPSITSRTINSLRTWNANIVIPMNSSTDTLTLASGGLLTNQDNIWITNGQLTAGATPGSAAELFSWVNLGTTHITGLMIDNSGGAVTLRKSGSGTLALSGVNQYTGGTVVDQGILNLEGTGQTLNTGSLTINNATVSETTVSGQIPSGTAVTLNGGSLNLLGNRTLPGLTLNAKGGLIAPVVSVLASGNRPAALTLTGDIMANLVDPNGVSATIGGGGSLNLGSSTRVVTVNGTGAAGVSVAIPIAGTAPSNTVALDKQGSGKLLISGGATYSGITKITSGTIEVSGVTPGLLKGVISTYGDWTSSPVPLGTTDRPDMAYYVASYAFPTTTTYVYSGTINIPGGAAHNVNFLWNIDDSAYLKIDGVPVSGSGGTTNTGGVAGAPVNLAPGYHAFELRVANNGGPGGAYNSGGAIGTMGFGVDLWGGTNFVQLVDPGDGSVFSLTGGAKTNLFPPNSPIVMSSNTTFSIKNSPVTIGSLADYPAGATGQNVLLGATLSISGASTSPTFSGSIQGSGGLVKIGSGSQTLAGVNTYTGKTAISYGEIRLFGGGKLAAPATWALDQLSLLSGGTLTFDNTATNDSARITGSTENFGVTFAGGTLRLLGSAAANTAQSLGDLTLAAGASTIHIAPGATAQQAHLTFTSLASRAAGATLNATTAGAVSLGSADPAPKLVLGDYAAGTPGALSWTFINGNDFAVYDTAGNLTPMISGATASSYNFVYSGNLAAARFNSVSDSVTAIAPGTMSIYGLKFGDNSQLAVTGTLTLENGSGGDHAGGIIKIGNGSTSTISGGTLRTGADKELIVFVRNAGTGASLTISSTIADSAAGMSGLTKSGSGTLLLGAANTYTGTTIVNEGTLKCLVANAITGPVTLTGRASAFDTAGYTSSIGALTVSAGSVINSGAAGTLTAASVTLGGGPAGSSASVNLGGTGKLILGGNITFAATNAPDKATIAGNLDLGGSARIITVNDSLATGAATDLDISAVISNAGTTLTKAGTGNLRLSAANTFDAAVNVNAGVLTLANSQALGLPTTGQLTTIAGATLALDGSSVNLAIGVKNTYSIGGSGVTNAAIPVNGAIVNLAGNNTLGGLVTLTADATITAIADPTTLVKSSLKLAGGVAGGKSLTLAGGGDFEIFGRLASNSIAGLTLNAASNSVLTISNTGTANAFSAPVIVTTGTLQATTGAVLTSDTTGGTSVILANTGAGGAATVDLNNSILTVGSVVFGGAAIGSSQGILKTGTGTLALASVGSANSVTYYASGNPMGATISGIVDLGATTDKSFMVGDSTSSQALSDLDISAQIVSSGATQVGLNKVGGTAAIPTAGAGQLRLSGTLANTYSGLTTVAAGTLLLAKSPNVNAIGGNLWIGTYSVPTTPVTVTSGTVVLGANEQIPDTATVTVAGGTFLAGLAGSSYGVNTFNETIGALAITSAGGTVNTGMGSLTAGAVSLSGGIIIIQGGLGTATHGGNLAVGTGGLLFNAAMTITANSDPAFPGRFTLGGDVTVSGSYTDTIQTALSYTGQSGGQAGLIDLGGDNRTVNLNNAGAVLNLNTPIANGSMTTLGSVAGGIVYFGVTQGPNNANTFTGLNVGNLSTVRMNADNPLPLTLSLSVLSGGTLDTWAASSVKFGSLAGSGTVTTSRTANDKTPMITFGLNNTSTTFSGNFTFASGVDGSHQVNLRKIGTGNWTYSGGLAALNTGTGNLLANQGMVTLAGAAAGPLKFTNVYVDVGGTLALDNTAGNADRLANSGETVYLRGGTLVFTPNSAGSSETVGAVSFDQGGSAITLNASGTTGATTLTVTTLNGATGADTVLLSAPKIGQAGGAGVANLAVAVATWNPIAGQGNQWNNANNQSNMSIRPDFVGVDSTTINPPSFVTRDPVTGFLRPLGTLSYTNELIALSSTGSSVANASNSNVLVSGDLTVSASTYVNSLTMDSGSSLTSPNLLWRNNGNPTLTTVSINSGGLLVRPGSMTAIRGGILDTWYNNARNWLFIHAFGDLTLDTWLQSTPWVTKSDPGTLWINRQQYYTAGNTLNGGVMVLNSGRDNTLLVNPGAGWWSPYDFYLNGGTLDLHGNGQVINRLLVDNNGTNGQGVPGVGGTVTSTAGSATLTLTPSNGDSYFGGTITGPLNLFKAGGNWTYLTSRCDYTGWTKVTGPLQLTDNGALSRTSSIEVNYTELRIWEGNLYTGTARLPTSPPITLRGGTFSLYNSNAQTSTISLSTVTAAEGTSSFVSAVNSGSTAINIGGQTATATIGGQTDITIGNLVRTNDLALVYFGISNSDSRSRVFLTQFNGADPMTALTNGIFGPWAVVNNDRFATYIPGQGVGGLGQGLFPGQSAVNITVAGPTDNVDLTVSTPAVPSRTVYSLRMASDNVYVNMASPTDRITIVSGGLVNPSNNLAFNVGQLSAGAAPNTPAKLYLWNSQQFFVNGTIVDNGSGAVMLVKSGGGSLVLTNTNAYSGGTVVNQGTLTLGTQVPGTVTLPAGGLTINGATVTMANYDGQIHTSTDVTINANGTLNLIGYNTLDSVTFNDYGGPGNATVNVGAAGVLTLSGDITATNDNPYGVPYIYQGILDLAGRTIKITTNGSAPNDLLISSVIRNGSVQKAGTGVLSLNATNFFTGNFLLDSGTVIIGAHNALGMGQVTTQNGTKMIATGRLPRCEPDDRQWQLHHERYQLVLSGRPDHAQFRRHAYRGRQRPVPIFYVGILKSQGGLVKIGSGEMRFNGSGSDYSGVTSIQNGFVRVNTPNATSPNSQLVLYPTTVFDLNGQSTVVGSIADGPGGAGTITNGTSSWPTLIEGADNTSSTYSGVMCGYNNQLYVTKIGLGTWTLAGLSTYTGNTTVNQGTLKLGINQAIATASPVIVANADGGLATLDLGGKNLALSTKLIFGGPGAGLTARGSVALGGGNLTLNAASAASNDVVLYTGAGNPRGATISGSGTLQMATTTYLQQFNVQHSYNPAILGGESELTILANLAGGNTAANSGFDKTGPGTLLLSNNGGNTYVGQTRVDGGTLRVSGGNAIPDGSQVYLNYNNSIAVFDLTGATETIGSLTSGGANGGYNALRLGAGGRLADPRRRQQQHDLHGADNRRSGRGHHLDDQDRHRGLHVGSRQSAGLHRRHGPQWHHRQHAEDGNRQRPALRHPGGRQRQQHVGHQQPSHYDRLTLGRRHGNQ